MIGLSEPLTVTQVAVDPDATDQKSPDREVFLPKSSLLQRCQGGPGDRVERWLPTLTCSDLPDVTTWAR